MPWRKTLFVLHRDVGFVALGLTLVYAISGIAVNHRRDWDYNQSTTEQELRLEPASVMLRDLPGERRDAIARDASVVTPEEEKQLVSAVSAALGRPEGPRNAFWRGPDRLSLFFGKEDHDTADYSPSSGAVHRVLRSDRFLLRQLNFLHLNESGRAWTWVADLYAVSLLFLGVTGVVMVKGRSGLWGRGGLLVAAGVLLPIAAWLLVRS